MRIFSYEEIDELGEGLIRQYLGKEAERTCCVDIEGFVTGLSEAAPAVPQLCRGGQR